MDETPDWAALYESVYDRQIRLALDRGDFEALPGTGKPLASDSEPYDPAWWINRVIHEENAGAYVVPPALRMRKIADELLAGAVDHTSERAVREAVADYNERAARVRGLPQEGRPVILPELDSEAIVSSWRIARTPRGNEESSAPEKANGSCDTAPRSRFLHRMRRQ